ncbi:MAG: FMN-binding negative transcriptional regulator [Parvularculales bacterium]
MYRPEQCIEERQDVLIEAIRDIQLATLVTPHPDGISVTHAPVVVRDDGQNISLELHVARTNPHWQMVEEATQSVAIFQGPHAYVSPSFYPSKQEHGKVVPTWAYIAVHAHGTLEVIQDNGELLNHLEQMTDNNEQDKAIPWHVDDAPEEYIESMMRGIVGLRFKVERLEGTWKLNQRKNTPDRIGTAEGLRRSGENGIALADAMRAVKSA